MESTVTTDSSPLDHVTFSPAIGRPSWSRTSAASRMVSPSAVSSTTSGVTSTIVGAGAATVSSALPATLDVVAVMVASPSAMPLTSPESSTRATAVSLDAQANTASATAWPFASTASAASRNVSVSTSVWEAGETATSLTCCATVIVALPDADPAVAVIVAVPLPAAVTSPAASTVATVASLLRQATAAPGIACPLWSRTSAVNWTVAPSAVSSTVAGLTVTVVGWGGSGGGSVAPSPQERTARKKRAAAARQDCLAREEMLTCARGSRTPEPD